jgi:hypothetical protein
MPMIRPQHTQRPLIVGDFLVNRRSGALIEIMQIDLSGNVMVLDSMAALDAEWQPLSESQISSCLWVRADQYSAAA